MRGLKLLRRFEESSGDHVAQFTCQTGKRKNEMWLNKVMRCKLTLGLIKPRFPTMKVCFFKMILIDIVFGCKFGSILYD